MEGRMFDDVRGRVCVMTGGAGVIGRSLAGGLAAAGVKMAIADLDGKAASAVAEALQRAHGVRSIGIEANVLDRESLARAKEAVNGELGPVDYLVNCAGGNSPKATTGEEFLVPGADLAATFYGLEIDGFRKVFDLNFLGTVLPTMVFTPDMVAKGGGAVVNISSMAASRPLTKVGAYSAAKASVNNFTAWLATHLAKVNIRVNAIAPGFFLTEQNRFLLTDEKGGGLTERGHKILAATPMGKFGSPDDIRGATIFLLSDMSAFVTGIVLPVDGGFSAYAGV